MKLRGKASSSREALRETLRTVINLMIVQWVRAKRSRNWGSGSTGNVHGDQESYSPGEHDGREHSQLSHYLYSSTGNDTGDFSSAIHRGLNQTNLIAAVVHGTIIELYVNHVRVAVVGSGGISTHGQIGVTVEGSPISQAEVLFQNAKVWNI